MHITQQLITPTKAAEYLERNKANRPVSKRRVLQYTSDMKEGRWKQTGDPLRFAVDGRLLDGQHRLEALIKANIPLRFVCIFDLEEEIFDVLDTGKIRNAADTLAIHGITNRNEISAAARLQYFYDKTGLAKRNESYVQPTNQDIMATIERHPGLIESVRKITTKQVVKGLMSGSIAGFFHYQFGLRNLEKAEEFFLILEGKLSVEASSPPMRLRQRLIENKLSKGKLNKDYIQALTIKAWNAYLKGETIKYMSYKNTESFPVIE